MTRSLALLAATLWVVASIVRPLAAQPPRAGADSVRGFALLRADGNGIAALRRPVTLAVDGATVADALRAIADAAHLDLTFDPTLRGLATRVSLRAEARPAAEVLRRAVEHTTLVLHVSPAGELVVARRAPAGFAAVGTAGSIRGSVRDAATGEPIGDVHVELAGGRGTSTARDGTFELRAVPAGRHALRFARIGYRAASAPDVVVAQAVLLLPAIALTAIATPLAAVRVSPGSFDIMEQGSGSAQALSRDEIRSNPQLAEDVFRAVNRLPGLTSGDLSAKFYVRGGPADELYVSLDGLELYEPFHLKDFDAALSILDVETIGGIELSTGGFGAEYGGHLTGVFAMRSAEPRTGPPHSALGVSVTNVRAMSQGGFAGGRGSWLVSARRGYLDLAFRLTGSSDSLSPAYGDLFAKMQYDVSPRHRLALHVLSATDRFTYLPRNDQGIVSRYGSGYAWATWHGSLGSRVEGSAVASLGRLSWTRHGSLKDTAGTALLRADDLRTFDVATLRQDWTLALSPRAQLRWGAEVKRVQADYTYDSERQRRLGDVDGSTTLVDSTQVRLAPGGASLGAYVTQRLRVLPSLVTEAGVRVDGTTYGARETIWGPRLSAVWTPRAGSTLRAAWGRYAQPQQSYELQVQDGLARFFPAERAEQRVIGVEQRLAPLGTELRVEAYDRVLTRERPRFVNVIDPIVPLPELSDDRRRLDPVRGDARGIELSLRRAEGAGDARRVDWLASYTRSRATDVIDGVDVPRVVDQPHAVYMQAAYRVGAAGRWRVSGSVLWHSGWPYTPRYFRADTTALVNGGLAINLGSHFGSLGTGRLPNYRRVDLRATRTFDMRQSRVTVFADVFNLLNTSNPRAWDYQLASNPFRIVRRANDQIGLLPTAGVTWEF